MLKKMFAWPIDHRKPELGLCPVVVLGHALHGDMAMLKDTLGFDAMALGTVVKIIDTQHLANECGIYPSNSGNKISLKNLVAECGFEYRDPHTANNDAAMTLIAAVQMVLPENLKDGSLQEIVDGIEVASKQQEWVWGDDLYCLRCGKYGHTKDKYFKKICYAKVKCSHCIVSNIEKRRQAAGTHRTECCISYALHGPEVSAPLHAVAGMYNAMAGLDLAGR